MLIWALIHSGLSWYCRPAQFWFQNTGVFWDIVILTGTGTGPTARILNYEPFFFHTLQEILFHFQKLHIFLLAGLGSKVPGLPPCARRVGFVIPTFCHGRASTFVPCGMNFNFPMLPPEFSYTQIFFGVHPHVPCVFAGSFFHTPPGMHGRLAMEFAACKCEERSPA